MDSLGISYYTTTTEDHDMTKIDCLLIEMEK